jgi:transcription elongation factor Elf1
MAGESIPSAKAPIVKAFNCPSCGASLKIRAVGQTLVVACDTCDSIIDIKDENYQVIDRYTKRVNIIPTIPLGTRGKICDETYEVIGYMQRSDSTGAYTWSEYLLFNPFKGFRWLMEAYGHWNFITMTRNKPSVHGHSAVFASEQYELYFEGISKVTYVLGEFYWRVKVGSISGVRDFISPPHVLSEEKDDDEVMWSVGEYLEPEEIKRGFGIAGSLPVRKGVAPNQPSPFAATGVKMATLMACFAGALCLVQFFTLVLSSNKEVLSHDYEYDPNKPGQVIATEKFDLPSWRSDLEIDLQSPVENNWLAIESALINDKTGAAYYFDQGVEHYSGVEDGESWAEGSHSSDVVISSVPAGTYYLTLEPTSGGLPPGQYFEVRVIRGVPLWSNFLWSFVLILIMPAIALWRRRSFEVSRWSDSDFSPYGQQEEE